MFKSDSFNVYAFVYVKRTKIVASEVPLIGEVLGKCFIVGICNLHIDLAILWQKDERGIILQTSKDKDLEKEFV